MLDVILGNPILLALAALVGMAIAFGSLLGFAAVRFEVEGNLFFD
jgi:electron transport complex protein RnfB